MSDRTSNLVDRRVYDEDWPAFTIDFWTKLLHHCPNAYGVFDIPRGSIKRFYRELLRDIGVPEDSLGLLDVKIEQALSQLQTNGKLRILGEKCWIIRKWAREVSQNKLPNNRVGALRKVKKLAPEFYADFAAMYPPEGDWWSQEDDSLSPHSVRTQSALSPHSVRTQSALSPHSVRTQSALRSTESAQPESESESDLTSVASDSEKNPQQPPAASATGRRKRISTRPPAIKWPENTDWEAAYEKALSKLSPTAQVSFKAWTDARNYRRTKGMVLALPTRDLHEILISAKHEGLSMASLDHAFLQAAKAVPPAEKVNYVLVAARNHAKRQGPTDWDGNQVPIAEQREDAERKERQQKFEREREEASELQRRQIDAIVATGVPPPESITDDSIERFLRQHSHVLQPHGDQP